MRLRFGGFLTGCRCVEQLSAQGTAESSVCVCQHVPVALKIDVSEASAALDSAEVAVRGVWLRLSIEVCLQRCQNTLAGKAGRAGLD